MIYGSTGTTLVSAEFKLFCVEPCLSVWVYDKISPPAVLGAGGAG